MIEDNTYCILFQNALSSNVIKIEEALTYAKVIFQGQSL